MKQKSIIKKFNPIWFAVVLGFGGIALASFLLAKIFCIFWLKQIAIFLVYFNLILFLILFFIWLAKLVFYRGVLFEELRSRVAAGFYSLLPAAMVMVSLNFSKLDKQYYIWFSQNIPFLFWIVGAIFEVFLLTSSIYFLIIDDEMKIDFINGGWLIPPVAALLTSIAGLEAIKFISDQFLSRTILWVNYFFFGAGLFIFSLMAVALFSKIFFFQKLNPRIFPSLWIIMVPFSLISLAFLDFAKITSSFFPASKNYLMSANLIIGPILIGTGIWLFILLIVLTFHYLRKIELPYGEGWWAFVFPTASVSIASLNYSIFAKELFFAYCGLAIYLSLIIITIIVLFRTIKHFIKEQQLELN